ncbi:MAG: DUF1847 domain-containing protein [Phycisphaerales bacterium]|nr:MAG: DUF1847 domain-containing protein [Phycisphaerales bacterium]
MFDSRIGHCASCETRECRGGKDCVDDADRHLALYEDQELARLHKAATAIEGRHYCKEPRIREIMLFARELEYCKLGLAFCVGLADEAEVIAKTLAGQFEVVSVCCKFCGISKKTLKLEQIEAESDTECMCNPAGQATILNEAGTQLNILCGLCVGHDAIFNMTSQAPVTTLIVKDRVLAHNPIGAIYSPYIRRTLLPK